MVSPISLSSIAASGHLWLLYSIRKSEIYRLSLLSHKPCLKYARIYLQSVATMRAAPHHRRAALFRHFRADERPHWSEVLWTQCATEAVI